MLCELGPEALDALKGAIVVLPAVAYANVGELAIDVLVATLRPKSLGAVESVNVLPVVGNDAYDVDPSPQQPQQPGRLATALELFSVPGRPLVFLQQRAPAALGRQSAFAAELVGWLVEAGAAALVVLSGLDAGLRRDMQLDSSPLRYLASSEELRAACAAAAAGPQATGPPAMELEGEIREEELALHHSLPPWPLVSECGKRNLPHVLMGCFSAEGDNAGEGLRLAAAAMQLLATMRPGPGAGAGAGAAMAGAKGEAVLEMAGVGAAALALRAPPSWAGLYGRAFPAEIF
ncbi:hypothetical protein PLESTB_000592500 [Pleodorina starrii]|uniref:Proteasome assembly chaperone 2 n=1 Tax=Pleodorina starrii TaxID=330485 RepID=A0A9W6F0J1_9CHLO|nr:hypothetical protein PLESTM_000765600 [Pleodorina starrii]GLC52183.1 hypothetical protein PLESTB_000592500 [Pleodorina starrii]GLC75813.1 hypothetical protein PLESTF_001690500 [Pleodorina starrii]